MQGFAEKKADKLVRVNLEYSDRIESIEISGDFFVHPEESIDMIEKELTRLSLSKLDQIAEKITSLIEYYNIQMVGITPDVIEDVIKEATGSK